jgi:hypothetical protein
MVWCYSRISRRLPSSFSRVTGIGSYSGEHNYEGNRRSEDLGVGRNLGDHLVRLLPFIDEEK